MPKQSLQEAIASQAEIHRFLATNEIKDLAGDYGELLIHKALGGVRKNAVNQGFDTQHSEYSRIELKPESMNGFKMATPPRRRCISRLPGSTNRYILRCSS